MALQSQSLPHSASPTYAERRTSTFEALQRCPLFDSMSELELLRLASDAVRRSHRRGEVIQRQGDHPGHMQLLISGTVKLTLEAESGEEFLVRVVGPGSTWGEVAAIDGADVALTATALDHAEVVVIRQSQVQTAFRENGEFAGKFVRRLTAQMRQAGSLIELTAFHPLDVGLARRLGDLAEEYGRLTVDGIVVDLPLTQSEIASMLGATRVRINLLLGRFQDEGLIRLGRGSFTLLNPRELQRRACR